MISKTAKMMLGESVQDTLDESKDTPLKVIEATRPETYQVCPHCKQEIFEKHVYSDDRGVTMRHSDCGGAIEMPESKVPIEEIATWLRPAIARARANKAAGRPQW